MDQNATTTSASFNQSFTAIGTTEDTPVFFDPRANYERPWLRDEILTSFLTALALYLVVSLFTFEIIQGRNKAKEGKKIKNLSRRVEDFLSQGALCLAAAIFALVRCIFEQIELRFGTTSDLACKIYQHQLVEIFHTSLTCLYLLLWSRQLKMYKHKALRHLGSPLLRFISMVVIIGYIASGAATAITYLINFTLISSRIGCVYDLTKIDPQNSTLPGLLLFVSALVFQFALLGLLIYPLVKHYKIRVCCGGSDGSRQNSGNVRRTVIRLSVCASVCVLSDMVSCVLLMTLHNGVTPISFWANVYTINLLVNILTVTLSFVDWKRRLFPWRSYSYKEVATNANQTSSSAL